MCHLYASSQWVPFCMLSPCLAKAGKHHHFYPSFFHFFSFIFFFFPLLVFSFCPFLSFSLAGVYFALPLYFAPASEHHLYTLPLLHIQSASISQRGASTRILCSSFTFGTPAVVATTQRMPIHGLVLVAWGSCIFGSHRAAAIGEIVFGTLSFPAHCTNSR